MTEIETIRLIGVVIMIVCVTAIVLIALTGKRVDEEIDDDDAMCCEPDYSYDLGRYVHTGLKCRNADYEYLKAERG